LVDSRQGYSISVLSADASAEFLVAVEMVRCTVGGHFCTRCRRNRSNCHGM